jgi:hypothetical protein
LGFSVSGDKEASHYQQSGPRGRKVPGELVAAVRYSGTWREKRYEENKTLLGAFIPRKRFNVAGEEIFARYASTLMPCFFGCNEVVIPVKPKAPSSHNACSDMLSILRSACESCDYL